MADNETDLKTMVAEVAAAYFSNNQVAAGDIASVISQIQTSLSGIGGPVVAVEAPAVEPQASKVSAAQARKSIGQDALVSFEDGKSYKTLRRHLATRGLTPEDYRTKWGLPADYPMVAPSYSARRSAMAKQLGLGQKGGAVRRGGGRRGRAAKS